MQKFSAPVQCTFPPLITDGSVGSIEPRGSLALTADEISEDLGFNPGCCNRVTCDLLAHDQIEY